MTLSEIISAASVQGAVILIAAFIYKTYLKAKIEKGIQEQIDGRVEGLKSTLRKDEEAFKAALKTQDEKLATLRSGTLSALSNRHTVLEAKRVDALEGVWRAAVDYRQFRTLVKMSERLRMPEIMDRAEMGRQDSEKMRQFGDVLWTSAGLDTFKPAHQVDVLRPYISSSVWAYYQALISIYSHVMAQFAAIRTGVGKDLAKEPDDILKLVLIALPHQESTVKNHGAASLPFFLDELEDKLLTTISAEMSDPSAAKTHLSQAAEIIRLADAISAATSLIEIPDNLKA
jgi:hypothetical protein